MPHYLTRAPVAIETFDDVGRSYKPYEQFYRPPTHAVYSNGYRMSPYHKDQYGPQQFDGCGGCGLGAEGDSKISQSARVIIGVVAGLAVGYVAAPHLAKSTANQNRVAGLFSGVGLLVGVLSANM